MEMAWLTILGVVVIVAYYLVLRQRMTPLTVVADQRPNMQQITLEAARALVAEAVAAGDKFIREPDQQASSSLDLLSPITQQFFSTYPALRSKLGGFKVAISEIRPSDYLAGFTSIGYSEDWDIVVKANGDEVFVVEGAETAESDIELRSPTIYHLVADEIRQTTRRR